MWKDIVKIHPAADMFPMMSQAELQELARDIGEHGLRSGVVFWTPESMANANGRKRPEELYLLDGRNRLAAIELAYEDDEERAEAMRDAIYIDPSQEGSATLLYSEVDPYAYVVSANIRRRHLTAEQKRELIRKLKELSPDLSIRVIAQATGASKSTVQRTLDAALDVPFGTPAPDAALSPDKTASPPRQGEPSGSTDRVVGSDGKSYPEKR
jgi:hypothetical protein